MTSSDELLPVEVADGWAEGDAAGDADGVPRGDGVAEAGPVDGVGEAEGSAAAGVNRVAEETWVDGDVPGVEPDADPPGSTGGA